MGIDDKDLSWLDYFEWAAQSPIYAPLVTLSVAALGVLASIHPEKVQASFKTILPEGTEGTIGAASGFWTLLVISAILFWGRRAAQARSDRRDQDARRQLIEDQEEAVAKLRKEFRTMPPTTFLNHYRDIYREIYPYCAFTLQYLRQTEDSYKSEIAIVLETIQLGLGALAALAQRFDQADHDRYTANLMLYVKSSILSDLQLESEDINDKMLHMPKDLGVNRIRGFLDFRKDLSAVSEGQHLGSAENLNLAFPMAEDHGPVAFGIPREARGTDATGGLEKWRIGPGAPHALLTGKPGLFKNTDEIEAWMEDNTLLGIEARQETMSFVNSEGEPHIGSFISLPLPIVDIDHAACESFLDPTLPMGVINIHRVERGIMAGQEESLEYFDTTVMSIIFAISELVKEMAVLDSEEYGVWGHLAVGST